MLLTTRPVEPTTAVEVIVKNRLFTFETMLRKDFRRDAKRESCSSQEGLYLNLLSLSISQTSPIIIWAEAFLYPVRR